MEKPASQGERTAGLDRKSDSAVSADYNTAQLDEQTPQLTVEEALMAVTVHAAAALGLADRGALRPGLRCDLALYRVGHPAELAYWIGGNPCAGRVVAGRPA